MTPVSGFFSFAPDSEIFFLSDKVPFILKENKDTGRHICSVRFPLVKEENKSSWFDNAFDLVWSPVFFSAEMLEQETAGGHRGGFKMVDCQVESMSLEMSVLEVTEMAMTFSASFVDVAPSWKRYLHQPSRILSSHDCRLNMLNDYGEKMNGSMIASIEIMATRDKPQTLFGAFSGFNSGIGHVENCIVHHVKRTLGSGKIDVGYDHNQSPQWIAKIVDVTLRVAGRTVKDGIDRVDVTFVGKKE